MSDHFPTDVRDQIPWIIAEIAELKRRDRNRKRTGIVDEVDLEKGLARVKFEDRDTGPYLGPLMPWKEIAAGDIKTHIPPTVGEQVDVVSESGDLSDGVIDMSTPSNENPRPHNGAEAVITKGDVRIEIADNLTTVTSPSVIVYSQSIDLGAEGGPRVARIGDQVEITAGSSAGRWPIVTGSPVTRSI